MTQDADKQVLIKSARHVVGSYPCYKPSSMFDFIMSTNATPLAALIEDALNGARVYELMSIYRPSDVLHYVMVNFSELDSILLARIRKSFLAKIYSEDVQELTNACFHEFDGCFFINMTTLSQQMLVGLIF